MSNDYQWLENIQADAAGTAGPTDGRRATAKLGEGSAFTLMLPLKPAEALAETRASETQSSETESTAELRVLAAEDNATNQLVLRTPLAVVDIEPTIVVNGREALAAWEGQTWDIVLMDIQMPEMNGIEATQAIRQRELETGRPRTPIVAVTANAMAHQVVEYEAAGMDGVVAKPVNMANPFNVMEQALAQAAAPAEPNRRRKGEMQFRTSECLADAQRERQRTAIADSSFRTMRPTTPQRRPTACGRKSR